MKKHQFFLFVFLLTFSTLHCYGQIQADSVELYLIETIDGNQYIGQILNRNSESIRLMTEQLGAINIKVNDIKKIELIRRELMIGQEYWFTNPQSTRHFWSPNGYGLKKGEGYYQNVWILFNQFALGLTNNISLGAGFIPLFLFGGTPTPVWITPKISIPIARDKFNLGAGALLGTVIGEEDSNYGLLYGIATFGNRDKNVSLGLGYGLLNGELASMPAINLSAMIRTGKRGYFISENYIIPAEYTVVLISLGGRSIIQRVGLDYGLIIPFEQNIGTFIAIPWLGISIPFGKKN
jgi:hypothetical protein